MARGLDSGLAADRQSTTPTPVVLVKIATGVAVPDFVRLSRRGFTETFASEAYVSRLFELDAGAVRGVLFRQCFNTGGLEIDWSKAPKTPLLPVMFALEKPTGKTPWIAFPNANGLVA